MKPSLKLCTYKLCYPGTEKILIHLLFHRNQFRVFVKQIHSTLQQNNAIANVNQKTYFHKKHLVTVIIVKTLVKTFRGKLSHFVTPLRLYYNIIFMS